MQNHLHPAHHRSNRSLFWIILFFATSLFSFPASVWSTPIGEVVLNENTIWTLAESPYEVTGTVHIGSGATLTVEAGVVVKFALGGFGIEVQDGATLVVNGEAAAPVIFTDIRDDSAGGDVNGDEDGTVPEPGAWDGIAVNDGGNAELHYAYVRYAEKGIEKKDSGTLTIDDCIIANSSFEGLLLSFTSGLNSISRCIFSDNFQGIWVWGPSGDVVIDDCTVAENTYGLTIMEASANVSLNKCNVSGNIYGVDIWDTIGSVLLKECTITDNDDYGIYLSEFSSEGALGALGADLTAGVWIEDSKVSNNLGVGINIFDCSPLISMSTITGNNVGIQAQQNANPSIGGSVENRNNIFNNATFGVNNLSPDVMINATFNWWGDYFGPTHDSNPSGRGDVVSDYVDFGNFVQLSATVGDLNNDNSIGLDDAIVGLQVITGMTPAVFHPEYALAGIDVNGDGRAGLAEVLFCFQGVGGFSD